MIKTLIPHGDGYALLLDRALVQLLDIKLDTPLEVTTDGRTLTVAPATDPERGARFETALKNANGRYGRALRKLAE